MQEEGERSVPARPVVLPETFTGEQNFDHWVSHFESVAAVNKWSDGEKLLWLRVRLTGKAHVAFDQLTPEVQQSYTTAKQPLQERFDVRYIFKSQIIKYGKTIRTT